jgi:vesicle transport protein SEC22
MSASSSSLGTLVARVVDGMILVATMDHMESEYAAAAKKILKTLRPTSPARCTIEAGPFYYHYILEQGVAYLTLCERGYPRRLAFQFLGEVHAEFMRSHGADLPRYSRPYACVAFEPRLSKMRREYLDPQAPGNLKKLNTDLSEIHNIMQQNIQDVLQRGEKLDVMESRSSNLLQESKKFEKYGRYINLQALYKTYGPVVAVVLVVLFVIYIRFFR